MWDGVGWPGANQIAPTRHTHEFNFVALCKHIRPLPGIFQGIGALLMVLWVGSRIHESRTPKVYARDPAETGFIQFSDRPLLKVSGMHRIFNVGVKPLFSEPGNKSFAASVGKGKGTAVRHWLLQNRPQKFLQIFLQNFPSTSLLWMATSENRCEAVACRQCRTPCTSAGPGRSHVGTDIKKN